jgi:hypothetical protein
MAEAQASGEGFGVALNGYAMRLRRSELDAVAAGLGQFDTSAEGDRLTLVNALRQLSPSDRAPAWELAVRRYARHKPVAQAAGEIGMDVLRADLLLAEFDAALRAAVPPEPEANLSL